MKEQQTDRAYWRAVRRKSKLIRKIRREVLSQRIPALREYCTRAGVEMLEVAHGWQFRYREYVLNWNPGTNRVAIQYRMPGANRTVPFTHKGAPGKPRIVVAIEEVLDLVRNE